MGLTERDWKLLGNQALENMEFEIAKKSFYRIRDCRMLLLINELEVFYFLNDFKFLFFKLNILTLFYFIFYKIFKEMKSRGCSIKEIHAFIFAHTFRFREAVQIFQSTNSEHKALEIFSDLKMFDQAQVII